MRLSAFQIKNFRSIQDTGQCEISGEDVAVLVGQNEAGKTSILEGLMAYENLTTHENDIRSDGTLPSICCEYDLSENEVRDWFGEVAQKFQKELPTHQWQSTKVSIIVEWNSPNPSDAKYRFETQCFDLLAPEFADTLAMSNDELITATRELESEPSSPPASE